MHHKVADDWIRDSVLGKSFADIGGLWRTVGEKVTVAAGFGASRLTMVDHSPSGSEDWRLFRERAAGLGVREVCADANHDGFIQAVGEHQIVHCNGVLYHTPDPVGMLLQLASITTEVLILGTIHLGRFGQLVNKFDRDPIGELPGSVFVPGLSDAHRGIIADAYLFPDHAPARGISEPQGRWTTDGQIDAAVFWWLHSVPAIEAMLAVVGFAIEDVIAVGPDSWEGRVIKFLCRKVRR